MKFTCLTEIYLAREQVVALWKDTNNLKHWQNGFNRYEHIAGNKLTVGSKGIMHYNLKGKPMELEETIIEINLPELMEGEYVHEHMTNRMRNTFVAIDDNTTIWKAEIHYTQFNGFKMKMLGLLGKKIFKAQTQKWLDNFKAFAEKKANKN